VSSESDTYWQTETDDAVMQEKHGFVFRAMLDTIDVEPSGKRVLDAGCNRGGFLRLLCDDAGIAAGWGYDPAAGAVADARELAGERPLIFEVADSVPAGWDGFDVAFSHEVLYLIHDLTAHARAVYRALVPGGGYYAVMGVHAAATTMADWHRRNAARLRLPPLYALDDVIGSFAAMGFEPAVARLKVDFIPVLGDAPSLPASLEYYYDHKVMLRFTRPEA
jgi:SAM-dependent methyltransferase